MRKLQTLALTPVTIAFGAGLTASQVQAQQPEVSISDATQSVGDEVTVALTASDFGEPGLGAWSIDIIYDPTVVTAVSCENGADQIAVCNPRFTDDSVRVSGASAQGLTGDFTLSSIVFQCRDRPSDTPLTIRPRDLMDATPRDLRPIDATLNHGSIGCGVILPATGTQDISDGSAIIALIGALAAVGMAATVRGALLLRRSA